MATDVDVTGEATAEPELSKPPAVDYRLLDYFSGNGIAAKTNRYERENGGGAPDPERRLINSGAVGFRQHSETELLDRAAAAVALREVRRRRGDVDQHGRPDWEELDEPDAFEDQRVSRGQRQRETGAVMARLAPGTVRILRLAYGPQDAVPAMKRPWDPEPGKGVSAAMKTAALREGERIEKLGPWRQVLPEVPAVVAAFTAWRREMAEEAEKDEPVRRAERKLRLLAAEAVAQGARDADATAARAKLVAADAALAAVRSALIGQSPSEHNDRFLARKERAAELAAERYAALLSRHRTAAEDHEREIALVVDFDVARALDTGIATWIVDHMTTKARAKELEAAKLDAFRAVREAWNLWADARGRRRNVTGERMFDRGAEPTDWMKP